MNSVARYVLLGLGIVFIVVGLTGHFVWNDLYRYIVSKQMVFSPKSEAYSMWKEPDFPIFLRVYLFNCTNSEELIATNFTVNPKMEELGPYTFSERRVKENITWNDNGTVSYQEYRIWHHLPEKTYGSLDDLVTNLNVPVISAAYVYRFQPAIGLFIDQSLNIIKETLFITATVRDLLFDGYNSSFLNAAQGTPFAKNIPYDKFGWFYEKNYSHDGMYTVFTGETDVEKIALIDKWNGSSALPYWSGDCNTIKGTVGELWPPNKKEKEPLTFFVSDVCRTLTLDYGDKTSYDDVNVYNYTPSDKLFANSSVNPDNACYDGGGEPIPNGLVNETVCKFGAPAFLSFPHFYMADPMLTQRIEGMRPDHDNHSTTILLEPMTGAPVSVGAKFQVNLLIRSFGELMPHFAGIPPTYFPMIWFSESVELGSSNMMSMLKLVTVTLPLVFFILFIVITVVGVLLILPAAYYFGSRLCFTIRKEDDTDEARTALLSGSTSVNTQYNQY